MWLVESALIGVVFLLFVAAVCWVTRDRPEAREVSPGPMPGEYPQGPAYGPFPADTGPLLIVGRVDALGAAVLRDTRQAIAETEWLIEQGEQLLPERRRLWVPSWK